MFDYKLHETEAREAAVCKAGEEVMEAREERERREAAEKWCERCFGPGKLGTSPLTVTVVAPDGVESQWVTMVETEPVFTAMEADQ